MSEDRITIKWDRVDSTTISCTLMFEGLSREEGTVIFGYVRGAAEYGWMADYTRGEQTFHATLEKAATEMRSKTADIILRGLTGSLESPPYRDKQIREVEEFLRRNE